MGYREEIEALDLADDVKEKLLAAHEEEVNPLLDSNLSLKRKSKRDSVKSEVAELSDMGFEDAPGLLKFVRRVYLSDDEEPGLVMLSDADLELSGEEATGAAGKEELTVAGAIRKFIELMPKNAEGKLNLSDQVAPTDDPNRPESGGPEDETAKAAEREKRTQRLAGRQVKRSGKRYGRASELE